MTMLRGEQVLHEDRVLGQFDFSAPSPLGVLQRNKEKRTIKKAVLSYFAFVWFWVKFIPIFGISGVFGGLVFRVIEKNLSLGSLLGPQACWLIMGVSGVLLGFWSASTAAARGWLVFPGFPVMPAAWRRRGRAVVVWWGQWTHSG